MSIFLFFRFSFRFRPGNVVAFDLSFGDIVAGYALFALFAVGGYLGNSAVRRFDTEFFSPFLFNNGDKLFYDVDEIGVKRKVTLSHGNGDDRPVPRSDVFVEEAQNKAEEFMDKVGEEIELSDLVTLYGYHILPLKVVVDWGGEEIIEQLLQSGNLKPADARYLRDEGLLNEEVLERLFQKCRNMAYSDQVSLVSAVFDGQTPEEQQIRERLAQYYNIEKGINNFGKRTSLPNKKGLNKTQDEEPKRKIKMRDPGAKYNFLASVDKDVTTDSGIADGHIIFHYPNIDDGIVLIEKLHKITTNKKNGMIEIKPDNESATYIMSEEEFINMKSQLIQAGKIDRTQLTQKWWVTRDPEHWIPHNGTAYWEKAIMQRFNVCEENPRYSITYGSFINDRMSESFSLS